MAQAIITKFVGMTNTKPARVCATSGNGEHRVYVTFHHPDCDDQNEESPYRRAAQALCAKLNWTGELISGGTKDGYEGKAFAD